MFSEPAYEESRAGASASAQLPIFRRLSIKKREIFVKSLFFVVADPFRKNGTYILNIHNCISIFQLISLTIIIILALGPFEMVSNFAQDTPDKQKFVDSS